jgi:hypothetical protein
MIMDDMKCHAYDCHAKACVTPGCYNQLGDLFTKPLDEKRFHELKNELNILDFSNMS